MKKRLDILIEDTCHECPYLMPEYRSNIVVRYSCKETGKKLSSGAAIDLHNERIIEYYESLNTLSPLEMVTEPHPLSIPEWCPLEDVE